MSAANLSLLRFIVTGLVLWSCTIGTSLARQVPITLFHTTGLSGQLDLSEEERVGGLLRCATIIGQARETERNVVLVDTGDFLSGAAESDVLDGRPMVEAMRWLKYDAMVPGDRDFEAGAWELNDFPWTAANLDGLTGCVSNRVISVDGVRVAFIGLADPLLDQKIPPGLREGLSMRASAEVLRENILRLREQAVEVVVLLVHQEFGSHFPDGVSSIRDMMFQFPGLDVVIGASDGGRKVASRVDGGVLYTQAAANGRALGRVDLVWDTVKQALIARDARVITLNNRVWLHGPLVQHLQPLRKQAETLLAEPLAELPTALTLKASADRPAAVVDLVGSAAVSALEQPSIVLMEQSYLPARIPVGVATRRGVWNWFPQDYRWATCSVTGAELRGIVAEALAWSDKPVPEILAHGLTFEVDRAEPVGQQVFQLRDLNGKSINARKRLSIAFPSAWLSEWHRPGFSASRRIFARPIAQLEIHETTMRVAVIDHLQQLDSIGVGGHER